MRALRARDNEIPTWMQRELHDHGNVISNTDQKTIIVHDTGRLRRLRIVAIYSLYEFVTCKTVIRKLAGRRNYAQHFVICVPRLNRDKFS